MKTSTILPTTLELSETTTPKTTTPKTTSTKSSETGTPTTPATKTPAPETSTGEETSTTDNPTGACTMDDGAGTINTLTKSGAIATTGKTATDSTCQ